MPCAPGRPAKSPHTLAVFCSVITFSYVLNEKILMTDTIVARLFIIQVDVIYIRYVTFLFCKSCNSIKKIIMLVIK